MDRTRILAAALLYVDGLVHLARPGLDGFGPVFGAVAMAFGAVYLLVATLLVLDVRAGPALGIVAPAVGLLVGGMVGLLGAPEGQPPGFSPALAVLGALDVAIVIACGALLRRRGAH